ncbi:MAG: type IV pilus secretin PilQ [Myxococcota bacterium]
MRVTKTGFFGMVSVRCLCAAAAASLLMLSAPLGALEGPADDRAAAVGSPSGQVTGEAFAPMTGTERERHLQTVNELLTELATGIGTAGRVTDVQAVELESGTMIEIRGDGRFKHVETFVLENPTRLVIDLPGLRSDVRQSRLEVGSLHARSIRVGEHADKVRIVVDAGEMAEPFAERQILPVEKGLMIMIGSSDRAGESEGSTVSNATAPSFEDDGSIAAQEDSEHFDGSETTAPSAAATKLQTQSVAEEIASAGQSMSADQASDAIEPAEEDMASAQITASDAIDVAEEMMADAPSAANENSKLAAPMPVATTVYGVEYEGGSKRDRVVVVGERPLEYKVYQPDDETFVLSLVGAAIDPDAAVRIAPESPGPVSLVTAFEQPDVARPEVRVVVKRAAGVTPDISREGALLRIDFPRGGAVAQTPPVFDIEPEAISSTQIAATHTPAPMQAAELPRIQEETAAKTILPSPTTQPQAPAARAPISAPAARQPNAPAALDPPSSIAILNEGGLMDGKRYVGRRISLDFKDAPIDDVLRLIAEVSDLNMIAGDEVDGSVTVRLVDVPWDQALDVVLLTHGLGFVRVGNVLRIAPTTSLAEEEELRLQERRAKERLEDLMVKLQPVNYADAKKISLMIGQLLTPRGTVNVDERTNTLIIKDIPSVIDEATALVKAVDTMTPQVMIEAKIVEANLDFSRELGSTWSFGTNPLTEGGLGGRDFSPFAGAGSGLLGGGGSGVLFGNPITAGPTGLLNMAAHIFDSKFNVELQLQAAESNGDGKVISSPRIITLDNSEASIEQGVSIPFQTFENGDAQLEFVDAVLQLKVTPHITADRSIIMDIEVSRNAPDDSVFTLTGSPAIAKNQVKTETLVKDGQTLVLGGIYVIDKSKRQSRVPFLSDIPFLGKAFNSNEVSDSRKELLIFVTPRIVSTPQDAAS